MNIQISRIYLQKNLFIFQLKAFTALVKEFNEYVEKNL